MTRLFISQPGMSTYSRDLQSSPVSFGRSDENHLVIDGRGVSRVHGRFSQDTHGNWWVEDLGSRNGINVNGRSVRKFRLQAGDTLQVGECSLNFQPDAAVPIRQFHEQVTISDGSMMAEVTLERTPNAIEPVDARRLRALYDISKNLLHQRSERGLIDQVAEVLTSTLEADVVVFGLSSDPIQDPDSVVVAVSDTRDPNIRLSHSLLRRTTDLGKAVLIKDTRQDADLAQAVSILQADIRSAICVPLLRDDVVNGFIYIDNRRRHRSYTAADLEFVAALGGIVGTAFENIRLQEAEIQNQRMIAELQAARRVQQAIMPTQWPEIPGWEIHGAHQTCLEVGGDYYAAIRTPNGWGWLVIADVCGKGAGAALLACSLHSAVHVALPYCRGAGELLGKLNTYLCQQELDSGFVTCAVALVKPEAGTVHIASAGHPYPIVIRESGPAAPLELNSELVLGVSDASVYEETVWQPPSPDAALLFYTDGVTEAFDEREELFGEDRLRSCFTQMDSAGRLIESVQRELADFRGDCESTDDMTLLALRYTGLSHRVDDAKHSC